MLKREKRLQSERLLAVMETTASMSEIEMLKKTIDTIKKPELLISKSLPDFSELGEIQGYYASFLKNLSDYNNYVINDFYGNKISSLTDEINGIQEYISRLKEKEKLYSENHKLEENKYKRDSSLYVKEVIAESDLKDHANLLTVLILNFSRFDLIILQNQLKWLKKGNFFRITGLHDLKKEKNLFQS